MKASIFPLWWNPWGDEGIKFDDTKVSISIDNFKCDESAQIKILFLAIISVIVNSIVFSFVATSELELIIFSIISSSSISGISVDTFIVKKKFEPSLILDSTHIFPTKTSTRLFVILSPSPVPPNLLVVVESA